MDPWQEAVGFQGGGVRSGSGGGVLGGGGDSVLGALVVVVWVAQAAVELVSRRRLQLNTI
jgi:hypothetical protein